MKTPQVAALPGMTPLGVTPKNEVQLYDLFAEDDEFVMRAPMKTVAMFLHLHPDATRRARAECAKPGDVCKLHHNDRRGPDGSAFHIVQMAFGSLGPVKVK